jgi:hypothetical protein
MGWVKIPSSDGCNFLTRNHCFVHGTTADTLKWYFVYLEYVLDNHNFRVHLGDFLIPLFNWKLGLSPAISHYFNKLKGEAIFSSMCLLGLSQHNYSRNSGNLLDLLDFKLSPCFVCCIVSFG